MERRFLIKSDAWQLDCLTEWSIKQIFIRWNENIRDVITISEQIDHSTSTRIGIHRIENADAVVETKLPQAVTDQLFESKICFTKTRHRIFDGVYVDVFDNKSKTILLITSDPSFTRLWVGQEVTDHSFFKNDYLISLR